MHLPSALGPSVGRPDDDEEEPEEGEATKEVRQGTISAVPVFTHIPRRRRVLIDIIVHLRNGDGVHLLQYTTVNLNQTITTLHCR